MWISKKTLQKLLNERYDLGLERGFQMATHYGFAKEPLVLKEARLILQKYEGGKR